MHADISTATLITGMESFWMNYHVGTLLRVCKEGAHSPYKLADLKEALCCTHIRYLLAHPLVGLGPFLRPSLMTIYTVSQSIGQPINQSISQSIM